jgi:hypothetical protein
MSSIGNKDPIDNIVDNIHYSISLKRRVKNNPNRWIRDGTNIYKKHGTQ